MNLIDYFFILILGFSIFIGFRRGLIKELNLIISWTATFFIIKKYFFSIQNIYYGNKIFGVSIVIFLFFLTLFLIKKILNYIFLFFIEIIGLNMIDKALGIIFGILRGSIIIFLFVFYIEKYTILLIKNEISRSILFFYLKYLNAFVFYLLQDNNIFKYFLF